MRIWARRNWSRARRSPAGRLRAIRELVAAGIPVSVNVAPIIPGLTDTELPRILEAIAEAGAAACGVGPAATALPGEGFISRLKLKRSVHPDRLPRKSRIPNPPGPRRGKLYDASYADRRRGSGPMVEQLAHTFDVFTRKYGLNRDIRPLSTANFRRPEANDQMRLF